MIRIKRAYNAEVPADGERFLVDRIWPRGIKKEALGLTLWVREVAPSDELRKWYGHDPAKFAEFKLRYEEELNHRPRTWRLLAEAARRNDITLVFAAREPALSNAAVLRDYLTQHL